MNWLFGLLLAFTGLAEPMPDHPGSWPVLPTALPRQVPVDADGLPDLLDDPPGRASLVHHPAERWPEPVEGWASETLLFHGVDGGWRALRMDALGLPTSSWPGHDTYGAGSLSPDGRWWAGRSRDGVIVLDLASGDVEVVDLGTRWVASVEWTRDSRAMTVGHGLRLRTDRVQWPGGEVRRLPYPYWEEPDVVGGRMLTIRQHRPYRTLDLLVLDPARLRVDARLHLDRHDRYLFVGAEWLDARTVLLQAGPGLLAWQPDAGRFWRLTRTPDPGNGFASLDVATGLL